MGRRFFKRYKKLEEEEKTTPSKPSSSEKTTPKSRVGFFDLGLIIYLRH